MNDPRSVVGGLGYETLLNRPARFRGAGAVGQRSSRTGNRRRRQSRRRHGLLGVHEVRRVRQLEDEDARPKRLVVDLLDERGHWVHSQQLECLGNLARQHERADVALLPNGTSRKQMPRRNTHELARVVQSILASSASWRVRLIT